MRQGLNTLLGGEPDESTSGRSYREYIVEGNRAWRHAYRAINALFFWQDNHCKAACEADLARARQRLSAYE